MARLPQRPQIAAAKSDPLELLVMAVSPKWIAAAVILAFAGTAVAVTRSSPAEASLQATVATWAVQQYVPSNAELLAAFQGYRR
jgi:hypothetical protein